MPLLSIKKKHTVVAVIIVNIKATRVEQLQLKVIPIHSEKKEEIKSLILNIAHLLQDWILPCSQKFDKATEIINPTKYCSALYTKCYTNVTNIHPLNTKIPTNQQKISCMQYKFKFSTLVSIKILNYSNQRQPWIRTGINGCLWYLSNFFLF